VGHRSVGPQYIYFLHWSHILPFTTLGSTLRSARHPHHLPPAVLVSCCPHFFLQVSFPRIPWSSSSCMLSVRGVKMNSLKYVKFCCVGFEREVFRRDWEGNAEHVSRPILHLPSPMSILQVTNVSWLILIDWLIDWLIDLVIDWLFDVFSALKLLVRWHRGHPAC